MHALKNNTNGCCTSMYLTNTRFHHLETHVLSTLKDHQYYRENKAKLCTKYAIGYESGLGTIEMVIILAVLVGMGILFKNFAQGYFETLTNSIFEKSYEGDIFIETN